MQGTYIASSPRPVSQSEFMRELRRAVGMPFGLPAAAWMVRLGSQLLLRTDAELALYGRYVVSRRLEEEGFEFRYPQLHEALESLFGRREQSTVAPGGDHEKHESHESLLTPASFV
jgi:NAD dependent epimerase/dehydratase family enzyme